MIQDLIKKYKVVLNTLQQNRELETTGDKYPYDIDIQNTKEYLKELEELALTIPVVSQQSELLAFKDWFNELPDDSDDRLYITDETIDRFKANCA